MNYAEVCGLLQIAKKEIVSYADLARAIGISRQALNSSKNEDVPADYLQKIEKFYNVKIPNAYKIVETSGTTACETFPIPYWEGCYKEEFKDLLLKDGVTECMMDYQVLVNDWGCIPENLRILSMPGEEMDGGSYPLKNQDLLIIDVGRTDTIESGVFVATSHGGTRIYVREIVERMSDEFMFFTTITNTKWKEYISKKWTMEQWKQADIQIVGRVIKNMSLKL